jgi:RNA polymerase sigma factor (sigma-70 family)
VARLYEQHGAMVLAICRRLLRDPSEAEDAAQQTFLSAQRALQNGSRVHEPAAWLATIARNECVTRSRARRREPPPTDAEPTMVGPDAHADAERRERVESLRDAIGSLPEQQREAILLREVRGLSYDEVAESLALSPSAVESLLFRARKGLQIRLRNAWAALSPVGWVAAVRDLVVQGAAGGDPGVGPVAAKAVAIGLGTAVIAGGALMRPGARAPGRHAAPPPAPAAVAPARHERSTPAAIAPVMRVPAAAAVVPRRNSDAQDANIGTEAARKHGGGQREDGQREDGQDGGGQRSNGHPASTAPATEEGRQAPAPPTVWSTSSTKSEDTAAGSDNTSTGDDSEGVAGGEAQASVTGSAQDGAGTERSGPESESPESGGGRTGDD